MTKGWVPSVLVIMILMLVGFSTGIFPKTVIASLGRAMSVQRYSVSGFGDSTDYGIYTFLGAKPRGERIFQARDRREQE